MSKDKQIGQPKEKRKGGRVGVFFLGLLVGLLLTIGLLGGAGCFVFFKVSPAWINRHFHAGLELPIDENLTLYQAVKKVSGLIGNVESYTLNDLNNDFGYDIGDNIYGIDITDLKDVGFGSLTDAISKKFKNISMYELRTVVTLPSSFEDILSNEKTYYVNNGRLFKEVDYSNEVEFEYTIDQTNNKLIIKNFEPFTINTETNEVKVQLRYLPISVAFNNITDSISTDITVGELRETYGISLPDYLSDDVHVNGIAEAIKKIKIGLILGYTIEDGQQEGTYIVKQGETVIEGIMAKIATTTVEGFNQTVINSFTVKDIFADKFKEGEDKGVLGLILETTTLPEIPEKLSNAVTNATLGKLLEAGVIPSTYRETITTKKIKGTSDTLSEMTFTDFLDKILNNSALDGILFDN